VPNESTEEARLLLPLLSANDDAYFKLATAIVPINDMA
jgi:hypothetical protein